MAIIEGARRNGLTGAGAPTADVTGLGVAIVGDQYTDTTAGKLYICTGYQPSPESPSPYRASQVQHLRPNGKGRLPQAYQDWRPCCRVAGF